jgi:hypothetical protein
MVSQSRTTSWRVRASSKILSISACTSARHVERLKREKVSEGSSVVDLTGKFYLFDRSMIALFEGLFIRDRLANDISA